ncbi:centrosomal protein POC5 isoform X2 [Erinaceus europaeus]|uniref:Centrosomal protein POC5 n=1 Tax=Erinaceus europaeus TaxID=9365 RepID=A0ABM3Y7K5_ERIEU|nr:centrosomal protein POC5 isoform X2 [Erinaceus europaeus]
MDTEDFLAFCFQLIYWIETVRNQEERGWIDREKDRETPAALLHHLQSFPAAAGNSPVVKDARMEDGRGGDLNASSSSQTDESSQASLSPRKSSNPVMDFFSSHFLADSSSPGSAFSSHADAHDRGASDFLVSDENIQKMENVLDLWSSGLKVISSLSQALSKHKERIELMRRFFHWRISHVKCKQDAFDVRRAEQHWQRALLKKVWKGWHSTVQKKWKDVVERACQARAEEVCIQLSNDYEARLAALCGALENAKAEIQRLQHEKEHFEDSMKKAFMRGVCALNLEAMSMFQSRSDAGTDFTSSRKEESGPSTQGKEHSAHWDPSAMSVPSSAPRPPTPPAAAGMAGPVVFPSATSLTSGAASMASAPVPVPAPVPASLCTGSAATAASEETYAPRVVTSAQQKAGRTITARITGKCDFTAKNRISSGLAIMGVSPPMSSVVVEKHHPVTVQTIPQATAAKYPRGLHPEAGSSGPRPLGTRATHPQALAGMPSIRVVD